MRSNGESPDFCPERRVAGSIPVGRIINQHVMNLCVAQKYESRISVETQSTYFTTDFATLFRFRHSHDGTGLGSAHSPFLASLASCSNPLRTVFPGAYFRYQQHGRL